MTMPTQPAPPPYEVTADDVARAKAEEARAEAELRGTGTQRRTLPLLDQLRVASPCSAPWDKMVGTDRARFCGLCEKTVYNVSAMSRDEAEQFLGTVESPCVRFYQRSDGTILTSDCPVGVSKKRRRNLLLAALATAAAAFAGLLGMGTRRGTQVQGGMEAIPPPPTAVTTVSPTGDDEVHMPMGVMAPMPRPTALPKPLPQKPLRKSPAPGGVIP
jgi:hypothetical protein